MKSDYSLVRRSASIGSVIDRLHKEELLCVAIQDRGSLDELLESVQWHKDNMNFSIHVIMSNDPEKVEKVAAAHPDITLIVFNRPVTMGAGLNAMATECRSTYFMVVRSDADLIRFDGGELIDILRGGPQICCLTPVVRNQLDEVVPTLRIPLAGGKRPLDTACAAPDGGLESKRTYRTLYPFRGLGLYKRALFQRIRGMDEQILSSAWQMLDFGARSWLFGFPVLATDCLQVRFRSRTSIVEDLTERAGAERCRAKVLGVRQINGRNYLDRRFCRRQDRLLREEVRPRLTLYKTDWSGLCAGFQRTEGPDG